MVAVPPRALLPAEAVIVLEDWEEDEEEEEESGTADEPSLEVEVTV